jgi:FtsH-binding integral membrane protein
MGEPYSRTFNISIATVLFLTGIVFLVGALKGYDTKGELWLFGFGFVVISLIRASAALKKQDKDDSHS